MSQQLTDASRAENLRRYAARIDQHAASMHCAEAVQRAHDWAAWICAEADRIDPLQRPENLAYVELEHVEPRDLSPFMPR